MNGEKILHSDDDKINTFKRFKIQQNEISVKGSLNGDVLNSESSVKEPEDVFKSSRGATFTEDKEMSDKSMETEKKNEDYIIERINIKGDSTDNNNDSYTLDLHHRGNSQERNSETEKWWHSKQIWLEWRENKNIGMQQSVSGRLLNEEPKLGEIATVRSSKPSSQKVYRAMILEILD